MLEYVQQHGDAHQLFTPGDADSIASESESSEEGTERRQHATPLVTPRGAPRSASQSSPIAPTIWSTQLQDIPTSVLQRGVRWQALVQKDQWQMAQKQAQAQKEAAAQVQVQAQAQAKAAAQVQVQAQMQAQATAQAQAQAKAAAQVKGQAHVKAQATAQAQAQAKAAAQAQVQTLTQTPQPVQLVQRNKGSPLASAARGTADAGHKVALAQVIGSIGAETPQGSLSATAATTEKAQSPQSPQSEWFDSQFKQLEYQAQVAHNHVMVTMERNAELQKQLVAEAQRSMQQCMADLQIQQFQTLTQQITEHLAQQKR